LSITRNELIEGIEAELRDTPEYLQFRVAGREPDGNVWKVYVDTSNLRSGSLDESLEGASAWWPGPPKGGADVLSVIPENEQINLRFATTPPPEKEGIIRIYPPRYLEALKRVWEDHSWGEGCLNWLRHIINDNSFENSNIPSVGTFDWLRSRQSQAFNLLGWDAGFLWGPPGTGKTTTLGVMLAQYLIKFPNKKVLLLSTTNTAVDQALVAVDKALEELPRSPNAVRARGRCARIGSHFIASNYQGREHLLPVNDDRLVRKLADLEAKRPDPEKVQAYSRWKAEVEQVRAEIRRQAAQVLDDARLAAMTTTRAVFTIEELLKRRPYDLIVYDEASQVGRAHALALAPLGRRCLFAGDPKQLAPIVQSDHPAAIEALGKSMFAYMDKGKESTCLLNEQSRMAVPICDIVSNVFYDGKLVVADDCKNDRKWLREREVVRVHPLGQKAVHLEMASEEGTWSNKYHGPIRYNTAEFICDLVGNLKKSLDESDIIVLTPFRAQRTLIKTFLRKAGYRKVSVSTVHRAQGSERHTVIFDPAMGNTPFLQTEDAPRLINVALSRAKARLVIILSPGDRKNPLFERIFNVIDNSGRRSSGMPIKQMASHPDFPSSAINKDVIISDKQGRIVEVNFDGSQFTFLDYRTGHKIKYVTAHYAKPKPSHTGATNDRDRTTGAARNGRPHSGAPIMISDLVSCADFPYCALNKQVQIGKRVGTVYEVIEEGRKFRIKDLSGQIRLFETQRVINAVRNARG
jgi:DNA replication ATP-dependent helicase/nuclease Dna2